MCAAALSLRRISSRSCLGPRRHIRVCRLRHPAAVEPAMPRFWTCDAHVACCCNAATVTRRRSSPRAPPRRSGTASMLARRTSSSCALLAAFTSLCLLLAEVFTFVETSCIYKQICPGSHIASALRASDKLAARCAQCREALHGSLAAFQHRECHAPRAERTLNPIPLGWADARCEPLQLSNYNPTCHAGVPMSTSCPLGAASPPSPQYSWLASNLAAYNRATHP